MGRRPRVAPGLARRHCPVCGGHFPRFLPAGVVPRPDAACPRCGSYERHRALWLWLRDFSDLLRAPLSVLHWAPDPGFERRLRRLPGLRYESADAEPGRAMATLDLCAVDRPDGAYDRILCSHVLEHVADEPAALRELARLLAPGGYALVQVPVVRDGPTIEDPREGDPGERLRRFGQEDHVRAYGTDVLERFRAAGVAVDVVDPLAGRSPREIVRCALVPRQWPLRPEGLWVYRVQARGGSAGGGAAAAGGAGGIG